MTANNKTISIEFGALSDDLSKQLALQKITLPENDAEFLERLRKSITLLKLHGLIPESIANKARHKLMKKIMEAIDKRGELIPDIKEPEASI